MTAAAGVTTAIANATTPTAVSTARTNYNNLTPARKNLVTNYATLEAKEASAGKIATDKAALTAAAVLNVNTGLTTVKTNLATLNAGILATGGQGSTITWNSANTAVTNVGVVTRAVTNTTGNLTATLTQGGITDTAVFSVTVLAKTFTLTADALTGVTITNDGTASGIPTASQSAAIGGVSLNLVPASDAVNFTVTGTHDGSSTGDITVDITLDGVTKQVKVTINENGAISAVTPE